MTRSGILALVLGALLGACGAAPNEVVPTDDASLASSRLAAAPAGKLPSVARPLAYDVAMKVDPREQTFRGIVTIRVWLDEAADELWLHGDDLRVQEVRVDGTEASYEEVLPTGVSRIGFAKTYPAGEIKVTIAYEADFDANLAGLFRVEEQGEAYALAKSESIQARRFLPGFDEPGLKAAFDIALVVPEGDVAISNTPIISRKPAEEEGFEEVRFATTRPLSTYLLSVAVGPFDVVEYPDIPPNAFRDTPLPLRGFARKGRGGDLTRALDITADMVRVFEEAVGLPYPYKKLDIVAAPQWPSGATELAGAITYRESRILLDENSGPASYRAMLGIHSHEIAHMWFGNLVTPPWWDDLWLKEAFATWGTPLALSQLEPDNGHQIDATARAIGTMGLDSLVSTRAVREPIDRNEDIRNAYDGITYSKGMAVIAMADAYFGANVFRPALGQYLAKFVDSDADSPDFYRVIGEVTNEPAMTEVFRSFIEQKGVPLVSASISGEGDEQTLTLQQSRYKPLGSAIVSGTRWAIPVCVKLGRTGQPSERVCDIMRSDSMEIPLGTSADYVMINADGAGYYRWTLESADWSRLVDNFDKLTEREALSAIDSAVAAFEAGQGDAQTMLRVLEAAAHHDRWQVSVAPMSALQRYADLIERAGGGTAFRAFAGSLYKARFQELTDAQDDNEIVVRARIERFLASVAQDANVRARLLDDASRFIGLNGSRDANALGSDRYGQALIVGVQDGGPAFFDKLVALGEDLDDPRFDAARSLALGQVRTPAEAEKVRQMALAGTLGPRETYNLVTGQMQQLTTRDETWDWLRANYAEFVETIPAQWRRRTPGFAGVFCEAGKITELEAFFGEVGELASGHERALAQTIERIELCEALAGQGFDELAEALNTP